MSTARKKYQKFVPLLSFVLLVAAVGGFSLLPSHAFVPHASIQPETGLTDTQTRVQSDTTASGSSGIKFGNIANLGAKGFGMSVPALASQTVAVQDQWLADMQSLGITWIRIDIDWWTVQPDNATTYDWSKYDTAITEARKYGMKVDGIIGYTPPWARLSSCAQSFQCQPASNAVYANYAKAVVQHFGSNMGAIEIWNEPNVQGFWLPQPSPSAYGSMLQAAYTAVKSVNPHMLVMTAGLAPAASDGTNLSPVDFLSGIYTSTGNTSFDAVGAHPYSYPATPAETLAWSGWSSISNLTPSFRSIMAAHGDSSKHIWMTEVGAPTGGPGTMATCTQTSSTWPNGVDHDDECLQARNITEVVGLVKGYSWAGVTFFYSYKDNGTTSDTVENFFGVIRADGTQKPSYAAMKTAIAK